MKKPNKIIRKEDLSKLLDNNRQFWDMARAIVKSGVMPENKSINDVTIMSCANCVSVSKWKGKMEPDKCPNCSCDNTDLVRVRYWTNGVPDYSVNLLRKK